MLKNLRFVTLIFSFIGLNLSVVIAQDELDPNFNRATERSKIIELISNFPEQTITVVAEETATPDQIKLANYFKKIIAPALSRIQKLDFQASLYHIALDRALYDDKAEQDEWMAKEEALNNEINALRSSKEWHSKITSFRHYASEQTGDLANFARRLKEDLDLGEFSEAEMPLLKRISELEIKIGKIAKEAPVVTQLQEAAVTENNAVKEFHESAKSAKDFEAAWKKIESVQTKGRAALGQYVAENAGSLISETAIIRTQLARSKGFKTWAEYVTANQSRHYAPGYKTADEKITFLKKLLDLTLEPYQKLLEARLKEVNGPRISEFRPSQIGLIKLPDDSLIQDYFPRSQVNELVRRTMIESGFDHAKVAAVNIDGFPRAKKHSHAYMSTVSPHKPKHIIVIADSGRVLAENSDLGNWHLAPSFIVQNYQSDGLNPYETAWHEIGHAMHAAHEEDLLNFGSSYGYIEVHSMTFERFFQDIEFLTSIGQNKEGQALPRHIATVFVRNMLLNKLAAFRIQISYALLDLEVWNRAYTSDSEPLSENLAKTFAELREKATLARFQLIDGIDGKYGGLATNHFYSGNVRYFGYIVAEVAAQLTAEELWNRLERDTGRRTLHQQPTLAEMLSNAYYRKGFQKPFPAPIESFTGKTFSAEDFAKRLAAAANEYTQTSSCVSAVSNLAKK